MFRILPNYYTASVGCVGADFLKKMGIQVLLLDIDNTVSLVDNPDPTPEAAAWIEAMQQAKMRVALVSNNDPPRVNAFADKLGVDCISNANKPDKSAFLKMCERLGATPEQCAVVGDQLFTDILGGNAAKMLTIWVEPLNVAQEPKQFRNRRKLENILVRLFVLPCKHKEIRKGMAALR